MRGWRFFKTRLSATYTYENFIEDRPEDALEILTLHADGKVELRSADRAIEHDAGDTVVYFARPREESHERQ